MPGLVWDAGDAIQGGDQITAPDKVALGDTVGVAVNPATDTDHWVQYTVDGSIAAQGASPDSVNYTWSCSVGSFDIVAPDGSISQAPTASGASAQWHAASSAGTATLTCTVDDAPGPVVLPDTGTRNDAPVSHSVTINVVDASSQGIAALQFSSDNGNTWNGVPTPNASGISLTVKQGDSMQFKAIATHPDLPWPLGKPVWSDDASGTGETTTVTFYDSTDVPEDAYTVTAECGNTVSAKISVSAAVGTGSFTLVSEPPTASVKAGDTSGTTVLTTVYPGGNFTGTVTFSAVTTDSRSNPVPGISVGFAPANVTIGDDGAAQSSITTITAAAAVPLGTYTVTVTGTSGGITQTATIALTVSDMKMTIGNANWSPDIADVGEHIIGTVTATITPDPGGIVTYDWSKNMSVWRSDDGTPGTFTPYIGNWDISWDNETNNPTFDAVFYDAGFYIIQVNATATVSGSDGSKTDLNASGYIGGNATDIVGGAGLSGPAQAQTLTVTKRLQARIKLQSRAAVVFIHGTWALVGPWNPAQEVIDALTFGVGSNKCEFKWSGSLFDNDIYVIAPKDLNKKMLAWRTIDGVWAIGLIGFSNGGNVAAAAGALRPRPNPANSFFADEKADVIVRLGSPPLVNASAPPVLFKDETVFDVYDTWDAVAFDYVPYYQSVLYNRPRPKFGLPAKYVPTVGWVGVPVKQLGFDNIIAGSWALVHVRMKDDEVWNQFQNLWVPMLKTKGFPDASIAPTIPYLTYPINVNPAY